MLKIMIVDDEFYFREALKISVNWAEYGFELCGEAKNGNDALEKVDILKPDVALVDINMPVMDGMEFVQALKEKASTIKIVLLTGYSEFKYAQQAVQFGVKNYLLKPINEDELINTLLQIKQTIDNEDRIKLEVEKLKGQVKESFPILKDKLLNSLIQGNSFLTSDQIISKFEYLNINIESTYYLVSTIELDCEENQSYNQEQIQISRITVSNIVNEIFNNVISNEVFFDNAQRICIIIGCDIKSDDFESELTARFEQIEDLVKSYLRSTVTIGIGNLKEDIKDISISYKESLIALKNKVILGNGKLIHYTSVSETNLVSTVFSIEHRTQLLMDMRMANVTHASKLISKIFHEAKIKNINHQLLEVICIEVISTCVEFGAETGHYFTDIFGQSQLNILEKFQSKQTLEEIESWVKDIVISEITYIEKTKTSKSSKLIEKVKQYVAQNFQDDGLNIDELAKHLYINYGYLCYLFKKETNSTINEYITEFRLKKGKDFLDAGNHIVSDVASKVGYADANYFGKCFKKFYGVSPSKYIENIQNIKY